MFVCKMEKHWSGCMARLPWRSCIGPVALTYTTDLSRDHFHVHCKGIASNAAHQAGRQIPLTVVCHRVSGSSLHDMKDDTSDFDSVRSSTTSGSARYHASLGEWMWLPVLVANSNPCILPTYVYLRLQHHLWSDQSTFAYTCCVAFISASTCPSDFFDSRSICCLVRLHQRRCHLVRERGWPPCRSVPVSARITKCKPR